MSPLFKKKQAESESTEASGKAKSLAVAVAMAKRSKAKKFAKGGEVSASNEKRPMPDDTSDDSAMVSRNSGKKAPSQDSWTDKPTEAQATKPSPTKLSHPARTDNFDEEEDSFMSSVPPQAPTAQPQSKYNEMGPDRQGTKVPDMQRAHSNGRPAYAEGGEVEDHYESIADAILAKRRRAMGEDHGAIDLAANAEESNNTEDQLSYDVLRKENYSESVGLDALDQPEDSNQKSPMHEPVDVNDESIVDAIRRKKKSKV